MQIVNSIPASSVKKPMKFKVVDNLVVSNEDNLLSKKEKQKIRNDKIADLTEQYNCLCRETKGRRLSENELIRAKELLTELRGLQLFRKLERM